MCKTPEIPKLIIATTVPISLFMKGVRDQAISKIEGKDDSCDDFRWLTWEKFESRASEHNALRAERSLYYNQLLSDEDEV